MRKLLSLFGLLALVTTMSQAQFQINVVDVTPTTITARFHPNGTCNSYAVLLAKPGELEGWMPMYGFNSVVPFIEEWGLNYTTDSIFQWTEIEPSTQYVIYVAANRSTDTLLITDTVSTLALGGDGTSIITITVDNITATQARVTCTPNDQTASFTDLIVTQELFNQIGEDSVISLLKASPYVFHETDEWVWTLDPGLDYYACAIGYNANQELGELARQPFTTLSANGISSHNAPQISIYPNPASQIINLQGLSADATISLYDIAGRRILRQQASHTAQLQVSQLPRGSYIISIQSQEGQAPITQRIVLQ